MNIPVLMFLVYITNSKYCFIFREIEIILLVIFYNYIKILKYLLYKSIINYYKIKQKELNYLV
jgi:hypothetical protein